MPFTLAHPAAVMPFRRRFVLSALVVGSLAPDLHHLLHLPYAARIDHTVPGIFLFCIPVGLALLWFYHNVVKEPLLWLFPAAYQRRAATFHMGPPSRFLVIVASIVVGALTHLLWDDFTHPVGWAVVHVPFLMTRVFAAVGWRVPLYVLLQYGSTIAGFVVLLVVCWRSLRETGAAEHRPTRIPWRTALLTVLAVAPAVVAGTYAYLHCAAARNFSYRAFLDRSAVGYLSALTTELLLFSVVFHCLRPTER